MKGALIVFACLTAVLVALVIRAGKWIAFREALSAQGKVLVPLILLAVVIASCVEVLVSPAQVSGWVGEESGIRGVLAGWLAGALTPGGGPIGLPLAGSLARRGASMPVLLTYLTSMSLLSLMRMPMEWGLLGSRLCATRWAATALIPPVVGITALLWQKFAR